MGMVIPKKDSNNNEMPQVINKMPQKNEPKEIIIIKVPSYS